MKTLRQKARSQLQSAEAYLHLLVHTPNFTVDEVEDVINILRKVQTILKSESE